MFSDSREGLAPLRKTGMRSPYEVGLRLWVRETCVISPPDFGDPQFYTHRDAQDRGRVVQYLADNSDWSAARDFGIKRPTPSIHMPRWASRITLEVVSVRVERLQDISERDVEAEGVEIDWDRVARMQQLSSVDPEANVRASFATLWDRINGKRAPWSSTPWVWVVEFRRMP